ncbi:MAG: tyrosine-type recombinase/integrase [Porticoccaceae bacterium]
MQNTPAAVVRKDDAWTLVGLGNAHYGAGDVPRFGRGGRLRKVGGIHSLRHAYATHQLESGLPVHQLQRLLGHGNLQATLRYTHWVPSASRGERGYADLIAGLAVRHG